MFDTTSTSLGIGVTGTDHPSSNLYITGNAYVSSNIAVGGVLTMGTVNVVARHDLESVTATGNTTPLTVEFQNATTGIVTTGNVEVGGELAVSGNVSDLNIVSNVNMLHTANTASIKLKSNVVTEFPRSKKLIKYPRVAMTQNDESGTSGYVTNASSWEDQASNQTYGPWNNFNGILNDSAWQSTPSQFNNLSGDWEGSTTAPYAISLVSGNTIYGEWVELKIPNKIQLHTCRIAPMTHSTLANLGRHRSPRSGYILGRVGATGNWTVLKNWSDVIDGWEDLVLRDFNIENPSEYYDYFRVVWTAINGNTNYSTANGPGYASSGEIEFLGLPEYDPDAHGTGVVVKSVPNVPNTDWLEVYYDAKGLENGSTTVNDLKPVGTANNGTVGGNTSVTDEAFTFDGTGDYITSTVTTGTGNQSFSVACWFKFTTLGGLLWGFTGTTNGTSGSNPTNNSTPHAYFNTTGSINFDFWANSTVTAEKLIEANRWYAGVWTYDGTTRKIYIDGTQVHLPQSSTPLSIIDNTSRLSIGIYPTNLSGGPMTGSVANFRLFNRALTTDEIYQLYAYQKEYFGHGDLGMTLKAGRLGIGTSEPRAALDVKGGAFFNGLLSTGLPAIFGRVNNANYVQQSTVDQNINDVLYTQGQNMKRTGGGLVFPVAGMYIIQLRTHCWYSGGAYAVRDEHQYNRYNSAGTIYSKQNRGTIYDIAMGGSGGNSDMHHASIVFIHANEGDYVILSHTTSPTTTRNYNNEWNYISAACVCLDDPQFSS
tara:strand:- start:677 stop:2971 length:2295 start_codon:yes stop_codon:yes gene_type:complete